MQHFINQSHLPTGDPPCQIQKQPCLYSPLMYVDQGPVGSALNEYFATSGVKSLMPSVLNGWQIPISGHSRTVCQGFYSRSLRGKHCQNGSVSHYPYAEKPSYINMSKYCLNTARELRSPREAETRGFGGKTHSKRLISPENQSSFNSKRQHDNTNINKDVHASKNISLP